MSTAKIVWDKDLMNLKFHQHLQKFLSVRKRYVVFKMFNRNKYGRSALNIRGLQHILQIYIFIWNDVY